jgi:hypothetical protein
MDPQLRKCLRCGATLQEGFIADAGSPFGGLARWHKGAPKFHLLRGVRAAPRDQKPIIAFRCDQCGTLDLVAQ